MANSYIQGTVSPTSIPLQMKHLMVLDNTGSITRDEYTDLPEGEHLSMEDAVLKSAMDECYGEEWPYESTGLEYERDGEYDGEEKKWVSKDTYYLYSPESGMTDEGVTFLQWVLKSLNTTEFPCFTYEGAYTCDKMRPGEFGGVACFITRDQVKWGDTADWLRIVRKSLNEVEDPDQRLCVSCLKPYDVGDLNGGRCVACGRAICAGEETFQVTYAALYENYTWQRCYEPAPVDLHPEVRGDHEALKDFLLSRRECLDICILCVPPLP